MFLLKALIEISFLCIFFVAFVGVPIYAFLQMCMSDLSPQTLEALGFTAVETQKIFEYFVEGYFEAGLGCHFPRGHSWIELAHCIQGEINDPAGLLEIMNDIIENGTKSTYVLKGLQVLKEWRAL